MINTMQHTRDQLNIMANIYVVGLDQIICGYSDQDYESRENATIATRYISELKD